MNHTQKHKDIRLTTHPHHCHIAVTTNNKTKIDVSIVDRKINRTTVNAILSSLQQQQRQNHQPQQQHHRKRSGSVSPLPVESAPQNNSSTMSANHHIFSLFNNKKQSNIIIRFEDDSFVYGHSMVLGMWSRVIFEMIDRVKTLDPATIDSIPITPPSTQQSSVDETTTTTEPNPSKRRKSMTGTPIHKTKKDENEWYNMIHAIDSTTEHQSSSSIMKHNINNNNTNTPTKESTGGTFKDLGSGTIYIRGESPEACKEFIRIVYALASDRSDIYNMIPNEMIIEIFKLAHTYEVEKLQQYTCRKIASTIIDFNKRTEKCASGTFETEIYEMLQFVGSMLENFYLYAGDEACAHKRTQKLGKEVMDAVYRFIHSKLAIIVDHPDWMEELAHKFITAETMKEFLQSKFKYDGYIVYIIKLLIIWYSVRYKKHGAQASKSIQTTTTTNENEAINTQTEDNTAQKQQDNNPISTEDMEVSTIMTNGSETPTHIENDRQSPTSDMIAHQKPSDIELSLIDDISWKSLHLIEVIAFYNLISNPNCIVNNVSIKLRLTQALIETILSIYPKSSTLEPKINFTLPCFSLSK